MSSRTADPGAETKPHSKLLAKARPIKAQLLNHSTTRVAGPIRILTASPEASRRRILRELLSTQTDFSIVGEARTDDEVVASTTERKPDIVLLDVALRTDASFQLLERLLASNAGTRVIVLAPQSDGVDLLRLIKLGARGVVTSDSPLLAKSIRCVCDGEIWLSRQDLTNIVTTLAAGTKSRAGTSPVQLTPRQREVLKILASGGTNREVARRLAVSEDTVKHHITKILDKTGMSSRLELALYAVEHGLVDVA